jgi:hypothetical protein
MVGSIKTFALKKLMDKTLLIRGKKDSFVKKFTNKGQKNFLGSRQSPWPNIKTDTNIRPNEKKYGGLESALAESEQVEPLSTTR